MFASKRRGSHRFRLTGIVSLVFGAILSVLFMLASRSYSSIAESAADVQLRTVLNAVSSAVAAGSTENSLEEVSHSPLGLSVAVFDQRGADIRSVGPLQLTLQKGSGVTRMSGNVVRYVSGEVGPRTIVVARNWADHLQDSFWLDVVLVTIWVPLVLIVGAITWLSATRTFRPLLAMADEAKELSSKGPGSRLAVPNDAEFGSLALRLNEFLDRIQAAINVQERFVADAAHELRTPLTILRGQVETTLLRQRDTEEYERVLHLILDESIRMSGVVESLLVSSQTAMADAPETDITITVQEAVDRWAPRFKDRGIDLVSEIHPARGSILPKELDMVLDNLLGNALWHGPAGSKCTVILDQLPMGAEIRVCDEGVGIPDDLKSEVFERFYRTDSGRNRSEGGFGIGLAICRRIAEQRGASVYVLDNEPTGAILVFGWKG